MAKSIQLIKKIDKNFNDLGSRNTISMLRVWYSCPGFEKQLRLHRFHFSARGCVSGLKMRRSRILRRKNEIGVAVAASQIPDMLKKISIKIWYDMCRTLIFSLTVFSMLICACLSFSAATISNLSKQFPNLTEFYVFWANFERILCFLSKFWN